MTHDLYQERTAEILATQEFGSMINFIGKWSKRGLGILSGLVILENHRFNVDLFGSENLMIDGIVIKNERDFFSVNRVDAVINIRAYAGDKTKLLKDFFEEVQLIVFKKILSGLTPEKVVEIATELRLDSPNQYRQIRVDGYRASEFIKAIQRQVVGPRRTQIIPHLERLLDQTENTVDSKSNYDFFEYETYYGQLKKYYEQDTNSKRVFEGFVRLHDLGKYLLNPGDRSNVSIQLTIYDTEYQFVFAPNSMAINGEQYSLSNDFNDLTMGVLKPVFNTAVKEGMSSASFLYSELFLGFKQILLRELIKTKLQREAVAAICKKIGLHALADRITHGVYADEELPGTVIKAVESQQKLAELESAVLCLVE